MAAEAIALDRYVDILELFPILEFFPAEPLQEAASSMALFAREIMPHFADAAVAGTDGSSHTTRS